MEYFYWLGYKIAFGLEIFSIIFGLTYLNSIRAKNLEKVGLYYSIYKGNFVEGKKPSRFGTVFGIILMLIINPLLSWITVVIRLYAYINLLWQKLSTPEKLKEIQYKLGATLLNKDEVKQLIQESSSFLGKKEEFEDEEGIEENNRLILQDDEDYYSDLELYKNKIYYNSHPTDYLSDFNRVYEYKIEGSKVYQRLLEDKNEHAGSVEKYNVKDGIVLEKEITERYNKNKNIMLVIMGDSKSQIKKFKKECRWNEIENLEIKNFIISRKQID